MKKQKNKGKWIDTCGRIYIDQIDSTKPSGKNRLTYDLGYEKSEDVLKLYSALRSFSNEVNKRFDDLKMCVEYPGQQYIDPNGENDIKIEL